MYIPEKNGCRELHTFFGIILGQILNVNVVVIPFYHSVSIGDYEAVTYEKILQINS